MAEQRGFPGFLATPRLYWRYFWSRRTPQRITLALVSGIGAALIAVYLVSPSDRQSQVNQAWQTVAQAVASLDRGAVLAGVSVLLALFCLYLIFARPYRRATYLATTPSALPPITVYVDAENQLSESNIRVFSRFLMDHVDGRRADLLYFLDASEQGTAPTGDKYKTLYRFGFRPIDVPHDPTGEGSVKEAVDKEIAMHAIERALLGPTNQEFILVTGDGDFVGLVYRLVALGHRVRVWASPIREAYRTLETYLDINVLDIARTIADLPILTENEEILYRVIKASLKARADGKSVKGGSKAQYTAFRTALSNDVGPNLTEIGYNANKRLDYWLDHLTAMTVFRPAKPDYLPAVGNGNAIVAARQLYAATEAVARALKDIASHTSDSIVRMEDVAAAVARATDGADGESIEPLRSLMREGQVNKRTAHTRYFARCARALRLVKYEEQPGNPDIVKVLPDAPPDIEKAG